jgi:hypothetical protein
MGWVEHVSRLEILILGWCILLRLCNTKSFKTTFVRNYILPCLYCARTTLHVSATHEPSSGVSRIIKCQKLKYVM